MREKILSIIACPACRGDFRIESAQRQGDHITSGTLVCTACSSSFPIEASVPRLLVGKEHKDTRDHFTKQWELRRSGRAAVETEKQGTIYGAKHDVYLEWVGQECLGGVEPGGWMVDAGCGSGEKTAWFAQRYPEANLVGFDLNDTLAEAAAAARGVPNIDFVQGDVTHPPFKKRSLNRLHSFGVLHHTPDTKRAFDQVSELVAEGGRCMIWIYPHGEESEILQFFYTIRDSHFLGLGHKIPPRALLWAVRGYLLAAAPWLLAQNLKFRKIEWPAYWDFREQPLPEYMNTLVFMLYDNLTPEFQHRHRRAEVRDWLWSAGFTAVTNDEYGHYWATRG
ncbi:MAG TPA: methyltransferase domain-containing protein [Candidatus Nanopelagicales bacterium]|nr:methyltransferase domain-containing protein [Candidatus Nanopelagicales bacterium]